MMIILFILIFSSCTTSLYSFNYQTVEHWRYLRPEKSTHKPSYFGYSLAVHRSSLLIGAPRDHSPHDIIPRRGAVWKCEFHLDNNCQRIQFRRNGEANVRVGTSYDNKTDQWLGTSLAANDGNIIASAPFLKHRINDGHKIEYEIPGGALIAKYGKSLSMIEDTQIFSPSFLNWHSRNYNQEGYGEFGFQVALSKKPARIIVTAPGSFYFRGGIHSIPILEKNWIDTRHPFTSPHYQWRDAGWLRYPSNYSSNEYDDWCYRGYALALGNFNDNDNQEIIVGIPKLDNYRGAIEIMNSDLDENSIRTLNGSQMGEYFGASICVVDINNDGLDDLIVGAPLYTVRKDGRIIAEAGRADIFFQTPEHNLVRKQSIEGTREGGRLGHTLANLGDIDKDGYNDVAISIPFINHGSSNMIHIYRGSHDGLILTPSQIFQTAALRGFGWALQGQFDYDNNGYLDLAVSSIHSETVAIILARPVLRLQTKLHNSSPTIPLNCTLRSDDACFILTVCIQLHDSKYQASKRDTLTYEIQLDKDKDQADKRLLFRESYRSFKKRQLRLSTRVCHDYSLYMKDDVRDKLKPIHIHIDYSLSSKSDANVIPPILDPANSSYDYNIPIQKDCGTDDICIPNLHISTAKWPDDYKVGLTKKILLDINVINTGENAYDTRCFVQLPAGVEYVSSNSSSITNLYCNLIKQSDRIIVCQLGNPLLAYGNISLQIHTAVKNYSAIEADTLVFFINVTSDNLNSTKLATEIVMPISSSPELVLIGVAKPEQIVSDTSDQTFVRHTTTTKTDDLEVVHTYTLHNKGPSDAKRTEVKFMWPMLPLAGFNEQTPLLYGIDLPNIIRVSDPKANKDRCQVYHSSPYEIPRIENERNKLTSFFAKFRPTMTKNFILQDQSSIDRFQGSLLPVYCHGPLCKTFICHIDTLPIGHSVLIQLKASLRYNHLQSKLDRSKPFIIVSNASAQVREIPLKFSTTKSQQQPIAQLKVLLFFSFYAENNNESNYVYA
ncbi:unnamed protein product [Rotaria magnacalcarata]|uniref:Integrin alpha-2 domain-containing protein n=1 Tax=Rotaria magnacalcarata TaxID=392030 RepID=A0A816L5K5_9BILA|nr:unnamed protein product [Rotaria magnacalcarata]CAF1929337.1 unnamed protein product [Rotaria magnacalcarata]